MIRNLFLAITVFALPLPALSESAVKLSYSSGSMNMTTDGVPSEIDAGGFNLGVKYVPATDIEIEAGYGTARGDFTSFGLSFDYEYEGAYVAPKYYLLNDYNRLSSEGTQIYSNLTFTRQTITIADEATTENTTSAGIGGKAALGNGLSIVASFDSDIDHLGDDKNYSFGVNYQIGGNHEVTVAYMSTDSKMDGDTLSFSGYYLSYYIYF